MSRRAVRIAILGTALVAVGLVAVVMIRDRDRDPFDDANLPPWSRCEAEQLAETRVATGELATNVALDRVLDAESAVAMALVADGEVMLVAQRTGEVVAGRPADGTDTELVLDLSDQVDLVGERGLLGMALDRSGDRLYLSHTNPAGDLELVEYEVGGDGTIAEPTRRLVLEVAQPHEWHNGGDLHVDDDGLLYLGLGDGGAPVRDPDPDDTSQDLSELHGSILRIDPTVGDDGSAYRVPDDNPFVDTDGARPEIWVQGLRNAWRFDLDPATGDLWVPDVGHVCYEEINHVPADEAAGSNFGWSRTEGVHAFQGEVPDDITWPVFTYRHGSFDEATERKASCAVIGGRTYRGDDIPELDGAFVWADFCNGEVRALRLVSGGVEEIDLGVNGGDLFAIDRDPDGEVYVMASDGVHRLIPADG